MKKSKRPLVKKHFFSSKVYKFLKDLKANKARWTLLITKKALDVIEL